MKLLTIFIKPGVVFFIHAPLLYSDLKYTYKYLQLHDIVGTVISILILSLCPLDVSTNNSSEILGDM